MYADGKLVWQSASEADLWGVVRAVGFGYVTFRNEDTGEAVSFTGRDLRAVLREVSQIISALP